jgi:hypothetical protein
MKDNFTFFLLKNALSIILHVKSVKKSSQYYSLSFYVMFQDMIYIIF